MSELEQYIKMIVENVFSDLVVRYKLKSGDISPLRQLDVSKFERLLKEFVEQNERG